MTDPLPTARELEALKVLWRRGRATVREIYRELRPTEGELAYTTVLSLMQTMERKGLVARGAEGKGKTHVYFARARSDRTLRQLAGHFLDTVFDGAVGPYVVRALESKQPSVEQLEELERMIADAKQRTLGRREEGDRP